LNLTFITTFHADHQPYHAILSLTKFRSITAKDIAQRHIHKAQKLTVWHATYTEDFSLSNAARAASSSLLPTLEDALNRRQHMPTSRPAAATDKRRPPRNTCKHPTLNENDVVRQPFADYQILLTPSSHYYTLSLLLPSTSSPSGVPPPSQFVPAPPHTHQVVCHIVSVPDADYSLGGRQIQKYVPWTRRMDGAKGPLVTVNAKCRCRVQAATGESLDEGWGRRVDRGWRRECAAKGKGLGISVSVLVSRDACS
jgi:hypothetical protein